VSLLLTSVLWFWAAVSIILAVSCSGSSSAGEPTTPATSGPDQLGREIGETYLLFLADAEAMLDLNLPAAQLRPALRSLESDYRVRLANLGCLRETYDAETQLAVTRAADAHIFANGAADTAWLQQATARHASDSELSTLLNQLPSIRLYAFFDQLSRVRPGEQILCN
jgi:hypothetical protein